jgi:hypothetical protein
LAALSAMFARLCEPSSEATDDERYWTSIARGL